MRRLTASGVVVLVLTVGATAFAATRATSPPASGVWRIVADAADATPPIYDFKGTFTVSGGHITKLTGTITHTYAHDEGCVTGTKIVVLGSQPIVHITAGGADEYAVEKKANGTTLPVSIRVKAGKQTTTGGLAIRFNTPGGFQSHSDLTFGNTIGCHLEFDVKR
ncbi:MAG TPA: hypothetical protein VH063_06885 [Gaiellaceae bacterium]|nr:hypothetical protein [Gaiellaceae bacterium]